MHFSHQNHITNVDTDRSRSSLHRPLTGVTAAGHYVYNSLILGQVLTETCNTENIKRFKN